MSEQTNTYHIPLCNIDKLHKQFEKINKRADKIGVDRVQIIEHDQYSNVHPDFKHQAKINGEHTVPHVQWVIVEIKGNAPKIDGYQFIGTLDHYTVPGSVIVKTVPGYNIPSDYFNTTNICDHCNKYRARIETFVLYNQQQNQYVQVGRNCLKDFFGHDPSKVARFLSALFSIEDQVNEQFGITSTLLDYQFDAKYVLNVTIACIRKFGWTSKAKAEQYETTSTADYVRYYVLPASDQYEKQMKQMLEQNLRFDQQDDIESSNAIEWVKEQESSSEYIHNLKQLAKCEYISNQSINLWCSLVATYQRQQAKLNEQQSKLNQFYGEVKQRIELEVYLVNINSFESQFGTTFVYTFNDLDGRTFVWFTNKNLDIEKQTKYNIKGTIKKHEQYKQTKQTHLSRVVFI